MNREVGRKEGGKSVRRRMEVARAWGGREGGMRERGPVRYREA